MKKLACILLTLAMLITGLCSAEAEDPSIRIARLEEQLADALALVEKYYPFYAAQVVAEFDGGCVFRDDVIGEYEYYEEMYADVLKR